MTAQTPGNLAWTATVLTLFPELFPGPLAASLSGRALKAGTWGLRTLDIRSFATDRHQTVDDTPAGGGPGMVMRADIVAAAVDHALMLQPSGAVVYLSPRGTPLTQAMVKQYKESPGLILLCGRFEGIDQRVLEGRRIKEVSIGDYVLSGGELAAMVLIDAVVRLLPGVMGTLASAHDETFENGLLEYPQYTRPRSWEGRAIPDVLVSGDHQAVARWRRAQAEALTKDRRHDLWGGYVRSKGGTSNDGTMKSD